MIPDGYIQSLLIDDEEFLDVTIRDGLEIQKRTAGGVQTMRFSLALPSGDPAGNGLTLGSRVVCVGEDDLVLFAGYLASLTLTDRGETHEEDAYIVVECQCQDNMRLLDSAVTGEEIFTSATDQAILQYLLAKYVPGVSSDEVDEVATIPSIDLSYLSIRECVERLAQVTRAVWYIGASTPVGDESPINGTVMVDLYYHEASARSAPFAIGSDAEGVSVRSIDHDGLRYSTGFAQPCNKAAVTNQLSEEPTQESFTPPAGTDDGTTELTDSSYPPTGSASADDNETTILAGRTKINPTPGSGTYYESAGANDGWCGYYGAGWPPSTTPVVYTGFTNIQCERSIIAGLYYSWVGLLLFDTSAIPAGAEITLIRLDIYGGAICEDAYTYLNISAYSSDNWPIDISDYVLDPGIGDSWDLSELTGEEWKALYPGPSGIVNPGATTGLRVCVTGSGTPTGRNVFDFHSYEGANPPAMYVEYLSGGTTYRVRCAHVRFDTGSVIPASATISGATLKLKVGTKADADSAQIGVEYHDAGSTIGSSDHENTAANDAYGYKNLSEITPGAVLSMPLSSPDDNIAKGSGYTGFRIHVKTASTPTGQNEISFSAEESADDPALEVTYIPGEKITGTYQDNDSIAAYGTFERVIVNPRIVTEEEADLQAEGEVAAGAWPQEVITASTGAHGLDIGQYIHVGIPKFGIDGDYVIHGLTMRSWGDGEMKYSLECGTFQRQLTEFLRRLALQSNG